MLRKVAHYEGWQAQCRRAFLAAVEYIRSRGSDPVLLRKANGHVNAAIAAAADDYGRQLIDAVLRRKATKRFRNVREKISYGELL